jgi:hypothetical protein
MKEAEELERDMAAPLTKGQTMIVCMSAVQRRMLARFGAVCGLDATYRVTMWGLPFFVLAVVNAQGQGFPAAFFWISEESSEAIAEALLHVRQMVPTWNPELLMVDKCDAEINAIKRVFPGCTIHLCDFHVKQAWQRWLNTGKHGVGDKGQKEDAYALLEDIAHAETLSKMRDAERALVAYMEATKNKPMQTWWRNEWEPCKQMWVNAYRSATFTRGLRTNNHNESMNKYLKRYLAERYDLKVGSMLRELYGDIVPNYEEKHGKEQAKDLGRKRKTALPAVLRGDGPGAKLPHLVTRALLKSEKASKSLEASGWSKVSQPHPAGNERYIFKGQNDSTYIVDLTVGTCACPHFMSRRIPCKHMLCVLASRQKTIYSLPQEVLQAPHMTIDLDSLLDQTYQMDGDDSPGEMEADADQPAGPVESFDDIEVGNASSAPPPASAHEPTSPELTPAQLRSQYNEVNKMVTSGFHQLLRSNKEAAKQVLETLKSARELCREARRGGRPGDFETSEGHRFRRNAAPDLYVNRTAGCERFDSASRGGGRGSGGRHGGRGRGGRGGRGTGRGAGGRGKAGSGTGGGGQTMRGKRGRSPTQDNAAQGPGVEGDTEYVKQPEAGRPRARGKQSGLRLSKAARRNAEVAESAKAAKATGAHACTQVVYQSAGFEVLACLNVT